MRSIHLLTVSVRTGKSSTYIKKMIIWLASEQYISHILDFSYVKGKEDEDYIIANASDSNDHLQLVTALQGTVHV